MSQVTEFDTEFIIANQRSEIPVLYIDDEIKQKLKIPISKKISNNTETDIVENTINQITKNNQCIPMVMRKRLMYEKHLQQEKENIIKQLETYATAPISLRKHVHCKEPRAS